MIPAAALALAACAATSGSRRDVPQGAQATVGRDGEVMAYRSFGRGPVVLVIPGGPGLDADYMTDVAVWIAEAGHRAVLLDPRGTGRSRDAIGDGSRLTIEGSVADVEALRERLRADRITLVGHSFGGAVAQAYADRHPARVGRLVLLDSVGPHLRPPAIPQDGWRARLTGAERASYDALRAAGNRTAAMRIKFLGSFAHRDRGERFVARFADDAVHADVGRLADDYARRFDVSGTARGRGFAVVVLAGSEDWIRGSERDLLAAYPAARRRIIPNAGHFPWADAPAATRRALRWALR